MNKSILRNVLLLSLSGFIFFFGLSTYKKSITSIPENIINNTNIEVLCIDTNKSLKITKYNENNLVKECISKKCLDNAKQWIEQSSLGWKYYERDSPAKDTLSVIVYTTEKGRESSFSFLEDDNNIHIIIYQDELLGRVSITRKISDKSFYDSIKNDCTIMKRN